MAQVGCDVKDLNHNNFAPWRDRNLMNAGCTELSTHDNLIWSNRKCYIKCRGYVISNGLPNTM